jgi:hypothetical protein
MEDLEPGEQLIPVHQVQKAQETIDFNKLISQFQKARDEVAENN